MSFLRPARGAYPEKANPGGAYRRHTPPDPPPVERVELVRAAFDALHETLAAAHGHMAVTRYEQDAIYGHKSEREILYALAWLTGGKPSDTGHMSPWDAAQRMWGRGQ